MLTLRDSAGTGCPSQNASETGSTYASVAPVNPSVCTKCFVRRVASQTGAPVGWPGGVNGVVS